MSTVKISQLPVLATASDTVVLPVVDSAVTMAAITTDSFTTV